jgi:hypothetical protein
MDTIKKYMVRCDQDAYDFLKPELARIAGQEPRTSEVKGLGGAIEAWIIAGTVGVNAATALLKLITEAINSRKTIKSVRIDDREIANPTGEEIEKLRREISS